MTGTHVCTERTIEYGTTVHRCTVCGRRWTVKPVERARPTGDDTEAPSC